jgi:hypothetical protein
MTGLPTRDALRDAQRHQDALADTGGDGYTAFNGWVLNCLWCPVETRGALKSEAREAMDKHFADLHELLEADHTRRESYTDEQLDAMRQATRGRAYRTPEYDGYHECVRSPQCRVPDASFPSGVKVCPRCGGYLPEFGIPK